MVIHLNLSHTHNFSWMIREEELWEGLILIHHTISIGFNGSAPRKKAKYKENTPVHIKNPTMGSNIVLIITS